jgi:hypothetical protein
MKHAIGIAATVTALTLFSMPSMAEKGAGDVMAKLQGLWQSADDPEVSLEFKGDMKAEHYGKEAGEFFLSAVMDKCEDEGGKPTANGEYLVEVGEGMCWHIIALTDRKLELAYIGGRGNTLTYTRAGEVSNRSMTVAQVLDNRDGFEQPVTLSIDGYLVLTGENWDAPTRVLLSDSVETSFMTTVSHDQSLSFPFSDLVQQQQFAVFEQCLYGCRATVTGTGMTEWGDGPFFNFAVAEVQVVASDPERQIDPGQGVEVISISNAFLRKDAYGWMIEDDSGGVQLETSWMTMYRPTEFGDFLAFCGEACTADVNGVVSAFEGGVGYLQLVEAKMAGAAQAEPNKAEAVFRVGGDWDTEWGALILTQEGPDVTGSYPSYDGGRVIGVMADMVFTGHWLQNESSQSCGQVRDGTAYWGRLILTFDNEGTAFAGRWSYCDAEPSGTWDGSLQAVH